MLIIDRIEGDIAVCERPDRTMVHIKLSELPAGVREGDCLAVDSGAYIVDTEETARRRKQNSDKFARLLSRGKHD